MSNSVSNRHLAPEIYAASRRMKGKSTETVVGDLTTKTFHDRQQQLNPHSVVGANLKKEEDASLHGRTAPVRGNLYGDMTDSPLYPRERPVNTSGHSATPPVQWQCAQDAQGRTYYYSSTGQTSWTKPPGFVDQPSPWAPLQDSTGRTYYYNAATGQTSWQPPPQQQYYAPR
jgi:hypothetical protein